MKESFMQMFNSMFQDDLDKITDKEPTTVNGQMLILEDLNETDNKEEK